IPLLTATFQAKYLLEDPRECRNNFAFRKFFPAVTGRSKGDYGTILTAQLAAWTAPWRRCGGLPVRTTRRTDGHYSRSDWAGIVWLLTLLSNFVFQNRSKRDPKGPPNEIQLGAPVARATVQMREG